MKFKLKIATLFLTITALLSFSACSIIDNSSVGSIQAIDITLNTNTGSPVVYNSLTEMLDNVRPSVVDVFTQSSSAIGTGAGSGVIIAKDTVDVRNTPDILTDDYDYYQILTCHHVLDGTDSWMVKDIDGNVFTAGLIGGDFNSDIAVITICPQLDGYTASSVNLAVANIRVQKDSQTPLKVGEEVVAIGNPLGILGGSVTKGIISSTNRVVNVEGLSMNLIQTDCSTNVGNSGGGLFDIQGNLIGITNSGYSAYQGLNFAVPIDDALSVYESINETYFYKNQFNYNYGYVEGRARVAIEHSYGLSFGYGMSIADYSFDFFNYLPVIQKVNSVSDYGKAGLRAGDIITSVSFNGEYRKVSGSVSASLVSYLNSLKVKIGDKLTFTILRNNVEYTVTVTFTQYIFGDTGCINN